MQNCPTVDIKLSICPTVQPSMWKLSNCLCQICPSVHVKLSNCLTIHAKTVQMSNRSYKNGPCQNCPTACPRQNCPNVYVQNFQNCSCQNMHVTLLTRSITYHSKQGIEVSHYAQIYPVPPSSSLFTPSDLSNCICSSLKSYSSCFRYRCFQDDVQPEHGNWESIILRVVQLLPHRVL